ncbi:hypothetical protein H8356DRAFT_1316137 [Neocallimastix lanati (nom. inval.)]|nr:hypothetical protein H8356DRAFT_1316137 [Neocallimastix sp. JGI-2020a]
MEFEEFTTEFITSLKTNNKNCLKLIEGHKTLVQANLVENATPENINKYVEEINKALLQTKRKFSVFEKILNSLSKKLGNQHDVLKLINENPTYVTADNKKVKAENAEVIKETPTKINTNNKYQEFEMTKSLEKLTKRVYYESDIYLDPRNEIFTKYQVDEMNYWVFA